MSSEAQQVQHAQHQAQNHAQHHETLPALAPINEGHTLNGVPTNSSRARGHSDLDNHAYQLQPNATGNSTATSTGSSKITGVRSALGLHAMAPVDEEHDAGDHQQLLWPRIRLACREPFAEFWGVFVMVMFGNASVAQVLLSERNTGAPGGDGFGNYQSISWCWGIGVMLGIYVAGDSGAYLNPAITLANCVFRGLPFRRFPAYLLAQFLGGFVAAGVVYANYISSIDAYAGQGVRTSPPAEGATAAIFCTFPSGAYLNKSNQFFSEFIASTLLIFVIFALKDASNAGGIRGDGNWFPLALFFLIFGLGAAFGYETGYALNLARDFGPRVMAAIVGYSGVWSAGNYYFWIPIVAPFCGCLFGAFLYDLFIYTGPESPINSPYMGLPFLFKPRAAVKSRWEEREDEVPTKGGYVDPNAPELRKQYSGAAV